MTAEAVNNWKEMQPQSVVCVGDLSVNIPWYSDQLSYIVGTISELTKVNLLQREI